MRRGAQIQTNGRPEEADLSNPAGAASYLASLSGDLAELARRHGLDTLGYILEMAKLEAENVKRLYNRP
jgi:hypothetical protein